MKFISSLVTDQDRSPLIDWLRQKTEQEMEAMGKILQGALLEAYGNVQISTNCKYSIEFLKSCAV